MTRCGATGQSPTGVNKQHKRHSQVRDLPGIPHRGTASREREASFQFRDGKIIRHTDRFGFYRWARQAFGIPGLLLGWTGWFRSRVRARVKEQLQAYMAARSASGEQL